jgi:uncharacterized protein
MLLSRVLIFVTFLAVNVGLGLYVTLRSIAPRRFDTPRAQRRLALVSAALVAAVASLEILARRAAPFGGGLWRPVVWVERVAGFSLMITLILLVTMHILAPIAFGFAPSKRRESPAPAPETPPPAPVDEPVTRRELVTRSLSIGAASVTSATVLHGALIGRHDLEVTEVPVSIPGLAPSLEGITIAQITDLHAGIFTGLHELERVVERVNRLRADLVVITGDVIDNNPAHIPDAMRCLGKLRGRLGVYAILGNHDLYTGAERVRRGLAAAGIPCLVDRSVSIHTGDPRRGVITLAGVNDVMARNDGAGPDLVRALARRDREAPVILLAHNPVFFDESAGMVSLQLSGHTHGGQVNVGGVAGAILDYVAGRYTRSGSTLYVSRGIGITGAPVRLAAAPEITRLVLTAGRV